jgi:hypothetical protein
MVSFEAKENMMKSLAKFGLTRTGAIVIASLIRWKANLPSLSHSKWESFFNNLLRGLTISTKFRNEPPYEVNLAKEGLQGFLVFRERDIFDGFNPGRVY